MTTKKKENRNISLREKFKAFYNINRQRLFRYAIFFIALFVFFTTLVSTAIRINEINRLVQADSLFVQSYDSSFNDPELSSLLKERTYKQALIKLSENDSIQLIVNLQDSIVALSIKGVIIHETKVEHFDIDHFFERLPQMSYARLFSYPLSVNSQYATIVKEPIVVRNAPKDTLEAALNAYEPDTLMQKPAFLQLKAEYGIHVLFQQETNPTLNDKISCLWFRIKILGSEVLDLIVLKKPSYNSKIIIKIPNDELRSIYRALPTNTFLVLSHD